MSDLIDRQAAIDAFLTELTKRERKNLLHTWSTVEVKYFVADMLEKLPSVQPEIVRCKDCIHWDRDTVRQNSNDGGWWNEAICERYSDDIWTSWKDADWYCADAERREG